MNTDFIETYRQQNADDRDSLTLWMMIGIMDSNPGIGIPGSRPIFSIPNPGFVDALIPGFRDYEKWTKCPNFTWYLLEKYFSSGILGQIPARKMRMGELYPNTKLRDHNGHRSTCAIVLNKLFMRLLYRISLDV